MVPNIFSCPISFIFLCSGKRAKFPDPKPTPFWKKSYVVRGNKKAGIEIMNLIMGTIKCTVVTDFSPSANITSRSDFVLYSVLFYII